MRKRAIILVPAVAVTALAVDCRDAVNPERGGPHRLAFATAGPGIVLDQQNGTLNAFPDGTTQILKGFNPTNPHQGDAIVATFFWIGSSNIITSVTDHLTMPGFPPVGNTYHLVEYVTAGGISLATYVATNVQNFPDPNVDANGNPDQNNVLAVRANLSSSITDGGVLLSAYSGVDAVFTQALGAHTFAFGTGTSTTIADPGAIPVNGGALAYSATLSNGLFSVQTPSEFTNLSVGPLSNTKMVAAGAFSVRASTGPVDPQWTWFFNSPSSPSTWLASVLALNPPATQLAFIVAPSTTTAGSTIAPPVQVAAQDGAGNTVASFSGTITVALGANPGGGTLSGTTAVTAVNGVATFSELSIVQAGNGYTLLATAPGLTAATSASFNITAPPPPPANDFMTGGGKLGAGRDFATFGVEAKPTGRKIEWVQHCLRGADPASPTCQGGQFTFNGTITTGSYAAVSGHPTCRTWSGSGTRKSRDHSSASSTSDFTVNMGCDNGQPGHDVDFMDITIGGYHASGLLRGGNVQLHKGP